MIYGLRDKGSPSSSFLLLLRYFTPSSASMRGLWYLKPFFFEMFNYLFSHYGTPVSKARHVSRGLITAFKRPPGVYRKKAFSKNPIGPTKKAFALKDFSNN